MKAVYVVLYVISILLLWHGHIVGGLLLAFVTHLVERTRKKKL